LLEFLSPSSLIIVSTTGGLQRGEKSNTADSLGSVPLFWGPAGCLALFVPSTPSPLPGVSSLGLTQCAQTQALSSVQGWAMSSIYGDCTSCHIPETWLPSVHKALEARVIALSLPLVSRS
jgi:hypothetical protein